MDRIAFILYLIAIILAPLMFAAVHTYAYTLVFLLIFAATVLVVINGIRRDLTTGRLEFVMLRSEMMPLFILMAGWLVFQMAPLPEAFVKWISPEAWVAAEKSIPVSEAIAGTKVENWITLAPYTYPVRQSLIRWVAYGMIFFGLSVTLNSKQRITTLIYCLLALGCFEVIYGLIQTYSGSNQIWWYKKSVKSWESVTGTYINRNHFAGLMEMLIPVAIGFAAGFSILKKSAAAFPRKSLRVRLVEMLSLEQRLSKRVVVIFTGVLMGIGAIFSASRGGMLGMTAALIVMGLLLLFRKGSRKTGLLALILFLFTGGYAIYIGVERPLERFNKLEASYESRQRYTRQTLVMAADYPVSGIGLGNFVHTYPKYQSPKDKNKLLRHAHNDWVQLLGEAGLAGFFLFLAGSGWFLWVYLRKWKQRRDRFAVGVGASAMSALTAIVIHSYLDFNLHVPANAMVLASILALGSSSIHLRSRRGYDAYSGRYRALPLRGTGGVILITIMVLIMWAGYYSIRHFFAETQCNTVKNSTLNRDQDPPLEKIDAAIKWDPSNAMYWFKRGVRLDNKRRATFNGMTLAGQIKSQKEITMAFEKAIEHNPFDAWFYIHCGTAYTRMTADEGYRTFWLPAADMVMERASWAVAQKTPDNLINIGNY